ncbi:Hpt domain protein [Bacteriovorax sp. BSW11_IV]|uniref:Hpt domain-containing protein n=1 Tax=Bacteriovorax sp. BSW11_IV TaxID=1353529 RepID=UPI00038A261A|nr:Hpt domain-containing protein [Bacteriovorax sp. BSW11_IV]EQC49140.1 Hpt domain protein [Bacteriovorax sp. BSW11_IV]
MGNDNCFDEKLISEFIVDAIDILDEMEQLCLKISSGEILYKDAKRLLFQKAHSLKGASGMFGYKEVEAWMHKIEQTLSNDEDEINELQLDNFFQVFDHSRDSFLPKEKNSVEITEEIEKEVQVLEKLLLIGQNPLINELENTFEQFDIIRCQSISEAISLLESEKIKAIITAPKSTRGTNFIQLREYFLTRKKIPTLLLDKNKDYLNLLEEDHFKAASTSKDDELKALISEFIRTVEQD